MLPISRWRFWPLSDFLSGVFAGAGFPERKRGAGPFGKSVNFALFCASLKHAPITNSAHPEMISVGDFGGIFCDGFLFFVDFAYLPRNGHSVAWLDSSGIFSGNSAFRASGRVFRLSLRIGIWRPSPIAQWKGPIID